MKRILGYLLSFTMVFTIITSSLPLKVDASTAIGNEEISNFFKELGINLEIKNDTENVKANQMLKSILIAAGLCDVEMDDEKFNNYIMDLKYIYDEKMYDIKPDQSILYEDVIYAVVRVLGFENEAEALGGYPMGYINAAKRLGIDDGIQLNIGSTVSGADAYQLIYNMLHSAYKGLYDHDKIKAEYSTILKEVYGIYDTEGVIEATGLSGLYSPGGAVADGFVKINGILYDSRNFSAYDLLGYTVKIYYDNKTKMILSMDICDDVVNEIIIDYKDISSNLTSKQFSYYNSKTQRENTISITSNVAIILNGVALPDFTAESFKINTGRIKVLSRRDSKSSVIQIWSGENYWVRYFDITEQNIVYDHYGRKIELQDYINSNMLKLEDSKGQKLILADIFFDDVLTIYKSPNSRYMKVVVSKDRVSGTIKMKKVKNGRNVYVINENEYLLSKLYDSVSGRYKVSLELGDAVECCLDESGEIYAITKNVLSGKSAGYLIAAAEQPESFDNAILLKILNADNTIKVYTVSDKVTVDGERISKENVLSKLKDIYNTSGLGTDSIKRQLIVYKANEKNEISFIDTASKGAPSATESNESLRLMYNYSVDSPNEDKTLCFRSYSRAFQGRVFYEPGAKAIQVPPENNANPDDEDFIFYENSGEAFKDQQSYIIDAYSFGDSIFPSFIVKYASEDTKPFKMVYSNTFKKLDEKGDVVSAIEGMSLKDESPGLSSFILTDECSFDSNIEIGDKVKVYTNYAGKAVRVELVYDVSDNKFYGEEVPTVDNGWSSGDWFNTNCHTIAVPLYEEGDYLVCRRGTDPTDTNQKLEYLYIGTYVCKVVYDKKFRNNNIYSMAGSNAREDSIVSYEESTSDYSIIIYEQYYGQPSNLVVYNK